MNKCEEMVCNDQTCRSKLCCEGDRLAVMFPIKETSSSWRLYEPSREAEREARKHKSVHPESCLCQGAGWLWGYEVGDYETDQKYQCREEQDDE